MTGSDRQGPEDTPWPAQGLETLGACPVCGQTDRAPLLEGLRDRVFGIAPGTWTLWRCAGCGNGYLDPRPDRATIGLAYAGYYTQEAQGHPPGRASRRLVRRNAYLNARWGFSLTPARAGPGRTLTPTQERQADRLVRSLPAARAGERLLDLGCGNGAWLALMRDGGWEAHGVEPDAASAAQARALGLPVLPDLFGAPYAPGSFDAITLNHVIEHLHDPRATLARCLDLLKPGGRLWIATPNLDACGRVRFGPAWRGLETPRHLVLFTAAGLRRLLTETGLVSVTLAPPADPARGLFLESAAIEQRATGGRLSGLRRLRVKWLARRADRQVRQDPEQAEELVITARRPGPHTGAG